MAGLVSRWRRFWARFNDKESTMREVVDRVEQAAAGILENEALTGDLDDEAGRSLLAWALSGAKQAARETADLDDQAAGELLEPRLKATRRLMRRVNKWASRRAELAPEEEESLLAQVIEQAELIYGRRFAGVAAEQRAAFLAQQFSSPGEMITRLRQLLEPVENNEDAGAVNG